MKKVSLNDQWLFRTGVESMVEMRGAQDYEMVQLPYDASIRMKRDADDRSGSGNGYYPEKNYVYVKKLTLPEEAQNQSVWLEFEGVYQNAFVYVNNALAGKCAYGYSNFYVNITEYVKFDSENEIKVVVRNEVPSGRWYTGGGIYRDVNLMIGERLHVCPDGIRVSTMEIEDDLAVLKIETNLENTGIGRRRVELVTEIYDENQMQVATERSCFTITEQTENTYQHRLYVRKPRLWSAETPNLYQYRVSVQEQGKTIDEETGCFGIRRLQLDPIHGLRVNGKQVKLRGGCIHHDNGIIGANEFPYAAEYRVKKLKSAGYNAIRSSHYPMSRIMLNACDKFGMYVMDEFSDVWTSAKVDYDYSMHITEWWEHDITNMVKKDFNHPSVIMYSIGNEIAEAGNEMGAQWGKKFADKIRSLDDTRYITNGINTFLCIRDHIAEYMKMQSAEKKAVEGEINTIMSNMAELLKQLNSSEFAGKMLEQAASQIDIMGYNYATVRYEMDHMNYPNRIIVGTETHGKELDENWELVDKYPNIIGDFTWTSWDYIGEAGVGKLAYEGTESANFEFYAPYPCRLAYCGDFNIIGDRRPISYWRETIWKKPDKPYIAVQPPKYYGYQKKISLWTLSDAVRSWNHTGYENKRIVVEVYADADEIQLLLNGEEMSREQVGKVKKNMVLFDTTYVPGVLEAVAYKDGKETGRDLLRTASDQVHIYVEKNRVELPADGSDIRYIHLELMDSDGNRNPELVKKVSIEAEGASVIGFGSANPESEENYYDREAYTFEGRLMAAVRGNGNRGPGKVTFKAEGCEHVTVEINMCE